MADDRGLHISAEIGYWASSIMQLVAGFQEEKNRLEGARALVLREFG